ncbi:MAG: hypothetical protein V4448_00425 [Pseudomonadota bacterium]
MNKSYIEAAKGIGIAAGLFILGFVVAQIVRSPVVFHFGLGDLATWFGAIGTIAAVLSGFRLSNIQYARERKHIRNDPLINLHMILDRASFMIAGAPRPFIEQLNIVVDYFVMNLDARKYRNVLNALNEYPIANISDNFAIDALFEMRHAMTKMSQIEGRPGFVQNLSEFRLTF